MIIAPYSTDAPIYHLPIATVAIMVINVIVFCLTTLQWMLGNVELESILWLTLEFDTINPLQWITAAFMHGDPMHLIGNMIFLWAFGLVVEGKIGSLRFALLYLIITLFDGAFGQIPMFLIGSDSGALGASGVIFALMVIAVIWAPENEMDCFYWFFMFAGTFEVRLVKLGGIYIFLQLLFLFLGGFSMSSEMLHMIGVVIGAPIGFYMLRQEMVDCEGWDLVSRNEFLQEYDLLCTEQQRQRIKAKQRSIDDPVTAALGYTQPLPMKGPGHDFPARASREDESLPGPPAKDSKVKGGLAKLQGFFEPERVRQQQRAKQKSSEGQPSAVSTHPDFNRLAFAFRQSVEQKSLVTATQTFQRMDHMQLAVGLGDKPLFQYVSLLAGAKRWVDTMRPLQIIAAHQGELADDARLRMAQVQISVLGQPAIAIQTLHQIPDAIGQSSEAQQKRSRAKSKLLAAAEQAIAQQR